MAGNESRWEEDERFYPSSHSDDSPIITYRHDRRRRRGRPAFTVLAKFCLFCAAMILFCVLMYIPVYNRANYVPKDSYKQGMATIAGWTNQKNRNMKIYVKPKKVTTIHEPPNVCPILSRHKKNNLFLLIIVCSATNNFEVRNAIRETWGSYDNYMETSKIFNKVRVRYKNYNYTYDLYSQEEELRYLNDTGLNVTNNNESLAGKLKNYGNLTVNVSFKGVRNVTFKKETYSDIENDIKMANKVTYKRDISLSKILPELAKALQSNLVTMKTDNVPDKEEGKEENRFANEEDDVSEKEIDQKEDLFQDFDMNKELAEDKTENYGDYNYESNVMKIPPRGYEDNQDLNKILKLLKISKSFNEVKDKSKISSVNPYKTFPEHKGKSKTSNTKPDFKLVFLLGLPPQNNDTDTQNKIDEEVEKYGDVIQEDFIDSYNNLTLKSTMMLKWVTHNCGESVRYILKSDDDMYVNVPNLMLNLRKRAADFDAKALSDEKEYLLIGALIMGAKPVWDSNKKWYSPRYMYAGRMYPPYLSGMGYALSAATAASLYNTSLRMAYFHLEDVFITGMCPYLARPRLTPRSEPLFSYEAVRSPTPPCAGHARATAHRVAPATMHEIHERMTDEHHVDKCERMRLTQVRRDRLKPKVSPKRKVEIKDKINNNK